MISPILEPGYPNAGKVGTVEYIDYLNDGVVLDITPSIFYEAAAIIVLKPRSLYAISHQSTQLSDIDKNAISRFGALLDNQDDDSKKSALKLAYSNPYLRALAVVDFRDYIEQEMEQHENVKRSRGI